MMIRVEGLSHGILSVPILSIPKGLCVVTGKNGSGKTTLLRLLAGISVPERGSITVDGRDPATLERGFVHEFPGKNSLFSIVSQEVASPLWFRHALCEEVERAVSRAARSVGIEGLLSREVRNLSGGEQVLCALATAVVGNPALLVLDEWDSHLDSDTAVHAEACIRAMQIPHVVWCTQDMDIAASADYVVFMDGGRVRHSGTPLSVFPALKDTCWYPPSWRWREWSSSSTVSS
ncbi:MAG: energy-coupling factor ABC transporter ATP-binding protein [Methanolinea sp.]|jgi:energy-coupling factor transport system ATP-binding protein|nr:energy-coupling factor ABC transporter ATP-binding protein [Methanolinea sp.]